jgi:hypothetical protein
MLAGRNMPLRHGTDWRRPPAALRDAQALAKPFTEDDLLTTVGRASRDLLPPRASVAARWGRLAKTIGSPVAGREDLPASFRMPLTHCDNPWAFTPVLSRRPGRSRRWRRWDL